MIKSPINYTGGKHKLLPQLLPIFPSQINTFIDLFCGGCNVGLNVNANEIIYNDSNKQLIGMYNTFKILKKETTLNIIMEIIKKYELSLVSQNGYSFYGCESSNLGVSKYNKEKYLKLRKDFNSLLNKDHYYYLMLYVLIVYSFNNQIRFNKKGEFNLPVGKRDFNKNMMNKLSVFIDTIQSQNCKFISCDFRDFDFSTLTEEDFIYIDPPYIITRATYNEQNGWTEKDEFDLLNTLERLNSKGIKFALSNVLRSRGKENYLLLDWVDKNKQNLNIFYLDFDYSNANYQIKNKHSKTEEVLITNY